MRKFHVTGMSCAACSARVEKAVGKVAGVTSCAVNLLTGEMGVEGGSDADVVSAVERAGYGCKVAAKSQPEGAKDSRGGALDLEADLRNQERGLRTRLWVSLLLLAALMYWSMGHMTFGWPLPTWFTFPHKNHVAMGLVQLLLSGAILVVNQKFFTSGVKGILRGAPNMDSLVALGAGAAWCWSTFILFQMTNAQVEGAFDPKFAQAALASGRIGEGAILAAEGWMGQYYFETAAMIVTLITVGKTLEARAKGKTTSALRSLLNLAPKTATVERGGKEVEIPASQVRSGDIFLVRPGENIPVDGFVEEGESAVNEAALTGESVPVDKAPGATVSAATANVSGFLRCRATRVGEDTTLAQIVKLVSDAAATKAPIAKLADKVSAVFVPAILAVAALTLVVWLATGHSSGEALKHGIAVLVVSCPCALGLATPVAIMVGSGVGAKRGVLFKTAAAIESAGRSDIVVLDKTGTITTGEPRIAGLVAAQGIDEKALLSFAAALERGSEHPLAKAIVRGAKERGVVVDRETADGFHALPGSGVEATVGGAAAFGGSIKATRDRGIPLPETLLASADKFASSGATPLVFARNGEPIGVIAVADAVKPDALASVQKLRGMGMRVVMLTGDNERTARAVAAEAGIEEVVAGVMPDGKHRVIEDLKKQGRVTMVGDGVNDAPALAAADLGLAIGAGTDVAVDAADAVLVKSRLADAVSALKLGRATLRNIRENLFWAFFYNILLIPLAAGALSPFFGWTMHPDLGALAMSLSSVCVVSNALRLNFAKLD